MNYKITNGSISYGAETVIEEINFEIKEKDKIAIVGRNGSGKTTFLKSIVDNSMLDEGIGENKFNIYKQGNPTIGYLKQIEFEDCSKTMIEEILKVYDPIIKLEEKISQTEKLLQEQTSDKLIKDYSEYMENYELIGGYTYKKEYEIAIKKFGFSDEDKNKRIDQFSGGQRTKIAFLKLILSKPDILLLDEPTNHLDITGIEWLEKYLKSYPKAVVIVSHDRMFLNRIVNKVYEIEYAEMKEYIGDYTSFEEQKKANYEKQLKDYEYQQQEIKRLKSIADRFRYKPTKAKMALSKLKKIEQIDIVKEPNKYDLKSFHINFNIEIESGKNVLNVKDLKIGYDKPLANINFTLYKGQKLGIIGENGIGKSTLLKTLNGNINKLGGEFEYGYHVKKEYFDQQMEFDNPEITVFDEMYNEFPNLTTTQIRTLLGTFLFTGEDVLKKIKVLSGGEKGRLQLCKIFKKGPNLLLLDEPTNHMDIIGKESLENILKEYAGTLIFVSHDRYFINKVADSLLIFEKNKVAYFDDTYEAYMRYKEENEQIEEHRDEIPYKAGIKDKENKSENDKTRNNKTDNNINATNSYFLNKEINRIKNKIKKIENEIEELEKENEIIKNKMLQNEISSDYVKLKELEEESNALQDKIDLKMIEWEDLNNQLAEKTS